MALSFTAKKRIRKSYGVIPETVQMPNLIEVQRASYEQFLQMHTSPDKREPDGLEAVFKSVFPIKDFSDRATHAAEDRLVLAAIVTLLQGVAHCWKRLH
jgi:DNA-directed RNA polymerase subunit beta